MLGGHSWEKQIALLGQVRVLLGQVADPLTGPNVAVRKNNCYRNILSNVNIPVTCVKGNQNLLLYNVKNNTCCNSTSVTVSYISME